MSAGATYFSRITLAILCFAGPTIAFAKIDENNNGMSDVWEAAYGKSLVASEDPDHDGFSNLLESIAGTDPLDGSSFPRIKRLELQPDTLKQVWQSAAGVKYQPLFSSDLAAWLPFGPAVIGTGEEMELTIDREHAFTSGGVEHFVWENLTGWGLSQIKDRVTANTPPTVLKRLGALEVPQSDPDKNEYGQYIRGWIIPPETGNYRFHIASDDQSELWLSTNKTAAAKVRICEIPEWTSFREWEKFPSQKSAAIPLVANTPYYFEFFQIEGNGGDHFSIAWQRPSMAADAKEILGADVLSSTGQSLAEMGRRGCSRAWRSTKPTPMATASPISRNACSVSIRRMRRARRGLRISFRRKKR